MTSEAAWAVEELADLAVAMRKDWDRETVHGKLCAMMTAHVKPCHALTVLAQVMAEPGSRAGAVLDILPTRAATPAPVSPAESVALAELRAERGWERPDTKAAS